MEERLQKILAQAGVASRRAAEEMITAGRVRVNGRLVRELGTKADPRRDKVEVDGERLVAERHAYVVMHKPRGVVSTMSDPEGRPTVAELVRGVGARLYPVGRLDFHTSGTLLLTNDGEFAHGLLHPREGVPKTYVVKVQGVPSDAMLERWRTGVELDDGKTRPCQVRFLREEAGKGWLEVTLTEGRNQQIRRMGEATGHPVMRLARLSFGGVTSDGLRPGEWRPLSPDELTELKQRYGVPRRVRGANDALAPSPARRPRPKKSGGFGDRRPSRRLGSASPAFGDEVDDAYEAAPPRRESRGRGPHDDAGERRPAGARPGAREREGFGERGRSVEQGRFASREGGGERGRSGGREGFGGRGRSGAREAVGERGRSGAREGVGERGRSGAREAGGGAQGRSGAREGFGGQGRAGAREGFGERQAYGERRRPRVEGGGDERRGAGARAPHPQAPPPRERAERGSGGRAEGERGGAGRRAQKSSAAVPSAKGQASKGTKSRSSSRTSRPR